jgi:hypothetical protein
VQRLPLLLLLLLLMHRASGGGGGGDEAAVVSPLERGARGPLLLLLIEAGRRRTLSSAHAVRVVLMLLTRAPTARSGDRTRARAFCQWLVARDAEAIARLVPLVIKV